MLNTQFSPWPSFTAEEAAKVADVILSNKVNYWTGVECRAFEKEFAAWATTSHAVALANGTLALDVALEALGVGPGDEVVVTPRTFFASASCIVTAGATPAEWQSEPAPLPSAVENTLAELRQRDRFMVGFAGSHGVANALETLLGAAALMRSEPVTFVLAGAGPEKEKLRQRAREEGLDNVCFLDPVAKACVPALLASFDLAYIGLQRQPLFRFGVAPNKLIDYMMAARPVLYAIESGNDLVTEAGCGISVSAENPPAVVQGIRTMRAMAPGQRKAMGLQGRRFVLENLTYPVLGQRFLKACA